VEEINMKRNHDLEFNITIGKIMERRRLAEGLSRRQVLNLINDQRSTQIVACYELGQKPVALPFAVKWCEVMGVPLDQLLELVERDIARDPWSDKG